MARELKRYSFRCDTCGITSTVEGVDEYAARPKGWEIGTHSCGDSYCTGGHEHEYCPRHIPKEYTKEYKDQAKARNDALLKEFDEETSKRVRERELKELARLQKKYKK